MSKVTLIGAGSVLWTPKILGDFYIVPDQPIDEICLMDINVEAAKRVADLAKTMGKKTGRKFSITVEPELERSVERADFVVIMISSGGLKAMEKDLSISEKYGVFHTVGDTVGPAGFSRLLRNVPVFKDMVIRIEDVTPDAWIINLSNPLTGITKIISEQTSMKTVGLCAGIVNHLWILKDLFGINDPSEMEYKVGGIDHCSWFLELKAKGDDIYPKLRGMTIEQLNKKGSFPYSKDEWVHLDSLTAGFTLFKILGYLPAISDRHIGEFFPFFLSSKENLKRYGMKRTTIQDRLNWGKTARETLMELLASKRKLQITKSRDIVVDVINALAGSGEIVTTVNSPNEGQIANLPKGSVVETLARVSEGNINPLETGFLPPQIRTIVLPHLLRIELVLKGALEGSRELFTFALMDDPTTIKLHNIPKMAEELLEAHKELLPQFTT